jgi:formate hydrogenlyase subunit 3/multisubunit Na+/H+ antiporter MnhD subunit
MEIFLIALFVLAVGGATALACSFNARLASWMGAGSAVIGCTLGLIPAVRSLTTEPLTWHSAWPLPYCSFSLKIDALAGFFLIVILGLSLLGALYGGEYLYGYARQRKLGTPWLSFNFLIIGMALTVAADNGLLFLLAWEVMTLSSFLLVIFEHEQAEVRSAGLTYLIAAHIGVAFLILVFLLLSEHASGSMDFAYFLQIHDLQSKTAGIIFFFSIIGFGTKAGFMPFHVWLPDAHPAAPSHVSAIMSGVMIKTGIYGILRILTFLGPPPPWWGGLLVNVGVVSGVLGVWFALAQHDLKRLLAYHSVENIGIIAMGLGIGLLGISYHLPTIAVLGLAGGLLHVMNHAIFKGLLFLGAGAVLQATHTREMDHLGGVGKKMPLTSVVFLIGAVAICGLPPLNGFISEFFIYWASFLGTMQFADSRIIFALAIIVALALIGGLAVACFSKAFSIVFLGEPRNQEHQHIHDPGVAMTIAMVFLAAMCFLVSILVLYCGLPLLGQTIHIVSKLELQQIEYQLAAIVPPLKGLFLISSVVLLSTTFLMLWRKYLLNKRQVGKAVTWDCGYLAPNARMQYTSSSYAQPLVDLNCYILRTRKDVQKPDGYFPQTARFLSHTLDTAMQKLYRPMFEVIARLFNKLMWLQHGYLHIYMLYLVITLLSLFVFYLGIK